ncbi:MAG: hypothetical protein JWL64_1660 [Frankiales bacterium]|nr:hypothetical protein [Frankiales bacterium]
MTLQRDDGRPYDLDGDDDHGGATLDLSQAAEYLGVSPTALARLIDTGIVPWVATDDVRRRRIRLADLEEHREQRFALRQRLAAEARQRRNAPGQDLVGT